METGFTEMGSLISVTEYGDRFYKDGFTDFSQYGDRFYRDGFTDFSQ